MSDQFMDVRLYWNGLISHTGRRNVLTKAGADPAEDDSCWDDLTFDARTKITLLVGGFRAHEPSMCEPAEEPMS